MQGGVGDHNNNTDNNISKTMPAGFQVQEFGGLYHDDYRLFLSKSHFLFNYILF
jgi:hypothetical protein